jgi:cobalt-zinc-cadmium efflux system membrane fusion protein
MDRKTLATFALSVAAGLLAGCHHAAPETECPRAQVDRDKVTFPAQSPQAVAIVTRVAEPRAQTVLRLNGRLIWDEDVTVHVFTPFGGRVARILAQAGQSVSRETPLAVIASPEYGQAQSEAAKALLDLTLAERTCKRSKELAENGAVPLKELHAAEVDLTRAQSEAKRTQGRLALYGSSSTNALDQEFVLKSPLPGVVVEKNINPGQEVRADQITANAPPLFVITDPARLWVLLDATEQDLRSVRVGATLTLRTQNDPDQAFTGRVETVADFVDPNSRTIKVRGTVDNAQRLLKAEMFVSVELPGSAQNGVDVPSEAVFLKGDKHYVFVEKKRGAYLRREVQVGPDHDGKTLVTEGLESGQKVVTDGGLMLDQMIAANGS